MNRAVEQSMFPGLRSDRAVGPLVPSVIPGTNADLIAKITPIYFPADEPVLDVTYGQGAWWKRRRPTGLVGHDLEIDGVDFTDLPYADRSWATVCFDPPYVPAGGASTSTVGGFQEAYGIDRGRSQSELDALMYDGLVETARVMSRHLLVKCSDFVSGGRFVAQSYKVAGWADELGLDLHDEIVHAAGSGPGGHNIAAQVRARRAHSKLLVFTHRKGSA